MDTAWSIFKQAYQFDWSLYIKVKEGMAGNFRRYFILISDLSPNK